MNPHNSKENLSFHPIVFVFLLSCHKVYYKITAVIVQLGCTLYEIPTVNFQIMASFLFILFKRPEWGCILFTLGECDGDDLCVCVIPDGKHNKCMVDGAPYWVQEPYCKMEGHLRSKFWKTVNIIIHKLKLAWSSYLISRSLLVCPRTLYKLVIIWGQHRSKSL